MTFFRKLLMTAICTGMMPMALVQAAEEIPATGQTDMKNEAGEDCSKEVILSFYPAEFVKETLKKYDVPQDQWDAIIAELGAKDKTVIASVEDKASKMDPNPLKDSTKQAEAVKIFRETLLQTFTQVLNAHGVQDEKNIQMMLDDIQMQKAKRFAECFPAKAKAAN